MKPLSEHLVQLIDVAECVMRRPVQQNVRALCAPHAPAS
jgi:hypothetical protein